MPLLECPKCSVYMEELGQLRLEDIRSPLARVLIERLPVGIRNLRLRFMRCPNCGYVEIYAL